MPRLLPLVVPFLVLGADACVGGDGGATTTFGEETTGPTSSSTASTDDSSATDSASGSSTGSGGPSTGAGNTSDSTGTSASTSSAGGTETTTTTTGTATGATTTSGSSGSTGSTGSTTTGGLLDIGEPCEQNSDCATGVCWDFNDYDPLCGGAICSVGCAGDDHCVLAFEGKVPNPENAVCGNDSLCNPVSTGSPHFFCT